MRKNKLRNKIIPQMFDVKPVDSEGNLDLEKIKRVADFTKIGAKKQSIKKPSSRGATPAGGQGFALGEKIESTRGVYDIKQPTPIDDEIKRFQRVIQEEKKKIHPAKKTADVCFSQDVNTAREVKIKNRNAERAAVLREIEKRKIEIREAEIYEAKKSELERKRREERQKQLEEFRQALSWKKAKIEKRKQRLAEFGGTIKKVFKKTVLYFQSIFSSVNNFKKILAGGNKNSYSGGNYKTYRKIYRKKFSFSFFLASAAIFLLIFGAGFFYKSLKIKGLAMENGKIAYANLKEAKSGLEKQDFEKAAFNFQEAYDRFGEIQNDIDSLGKIIVESSKFLPYFSQLSSGSHLAQAGKNISQIGKSASETISLLNKIKNPLETENKESVSFLKIFQDSNRNIAEVAVELDELEGNLNEINLEDIPEEQRTQFTELKKKLPEINNFVVGFAEEGKILTDVLGGNGPRKYLFLFQNNQEMRATGGFIGTYAVLDISEGNVKNFFIDGIFNPDGQLREKVIPPVPIQKISANWSLHDSNWFPDFPVSAEKAAWFYEKTGGPTVDGVITMTPTIMQKLLEITGPIEMPEYNLTINKDNFLENIQTEVEVNYDKEINQPKKILADLAPKVLDRIFNARNISDIAKTMSALLTSLNEKHILIYSKNYAVEKMLSVNGWSGEILDTRKDYLSVINTNINGFKTDGVIDEKIEHKAEIQSDGSIIDTVSITRQHNGGNTPYEWWNKVNANYMRVYVPKGSKLISASGHVKEFNSPPLDYKALGFKQDSQVGMENDSTIIDEESGTRIYEDSGKTVFANWTYVSPQETTTVTYSYLLPFKLDTNLTTNPVDTYSLLAQKQSGSIGSEFFSKIIYPDFYKIIWQYPDQDIANSSNQEEKKITIELKTDLKTDKFIGAAFGKNE